MAGSLRLSDATVAPTATLTVSGVLPPRRARTVKLQSKVGGSWVVLATKKSTGTGAFSFTTNAPAVAGKRPYRVLAPAATLGGTRHASVVTPARTLTVVTMTAVTAGWRHACALGSDHRAWCWGDNTYGELGDGRGATFDEGNPLISRPVQVKGGNWAALDAMGGSTCGRKRDNTAWCWGDHAAVTTGVASGKAPAPVQIEGQWRRIASGWQHACGVRTDGSGWCWGGDRGQLGTDQPVPLGTKSQLPGSWIAVVPGGTGASIGDQVDELTCGIKSDRSAYCWGRNDHGQLGDGSTDSSRTPVEVAGDHEWARLSVGGHHVCGVTTDGAGWCWGANVDGRLGDGTFTERHEPVRVTVAGAWTTLDAGFQHTCGVTTAKAARCWGWNDGGQLGDGTTETTYFPDPKVSLLPGTWRDIAAGHAHTAGARDPGAAWAWGDGAHGETGHGVTAASGTPTAVAINP